MAMSARRQWIAMGSTVVLDESVQEAQVEVVLQA